MFYVFAKWCEGWRLNVPKLFQSSFVSFFSLQTKKQLCVCYMFSSERSSLEEDKGLWWQRISLLKDFTFCHFCFSGRSFYMLRFFGCLDCGAAVVKIMYFFYFNRIVSRWTADRKDRLTNKSTIIEMQQLYLLSIPIGGTVSTLWNSNSVTDMLGQVTSAS